MLFKKKWILAVLALSLLLSLCGCSGISAGVEAYHAYEADQQLVYVAFSAEDETVDPFDYRQIAEYESVFSPYNSRVLYDTLNPAEQQIYRIFEYALDHGYTTVFLDVQLLTDLEVSVPDILEFLCMDSPFAEQNYTYSSANTGYTFTYLFDLLRFERNGLEIETNMFSRATLEKKKAALEEAKKLVSGVPQGLSQLETARWFYRYLTEEVTYSLYDDPKATHHYLYDALCTGKAQCDGFANAFSLLCQLSGMDCFEKLYTPEAEGETGHTWNCFRADGIWYNADCALNEDFAKEQKASDIDFCFAFSDSRLEHEQSYPERLPPCTANLIPVDVALASPEDPGIPGHIRAAFGRTPEHYILVRLESGELDDDDFQGIANALRSNLYSIRYNWEGKTHYYIIKRP